MAHDRTLRKVAPVAGTIEAPRLPGLLKIAGAVPLAFVAAAEIAIYGSGLVMRRMTRDKRRHTETRS
jgi:hypothetical protein